MDDRTPASSVDEFLGVEAPGFLARHGRRIWIAAVVVALALAVALALGSRDEAPRYATAEVTRGDLEVTISATGHLAPTNEVDVGSELSGLIESVLVDVNDRVDKGQPLARLDRLRLRDTIARSEAALQQAQANVAQAEATQRQSRASLARFEEVHRLSGGKVPSATELDTARADLARAVANTRATVAAVASAQAQLSSDRTNLEKATIRSPVTGVVLSRQVEPGQTVAASFNTPTLFRIAEDLASMKLEVKVDEADVGQVESGQAATFAVDAFPDRVFQATIKRVDVGANSDSSGSSTTTTASSGSSTVVAYTAVLTVQNPDLKLRPGMTATAEIVTQTANDVLLVPNAALRFRPGDAAAQPRTSAFPVMTGPPGRMNQRPAKTAQVKRGSQQTLYVLGAAGELQPLAVTVGASDGTSTIVAGAGVRAGLKVATSQLASES